MRIVEIMNDNRIHLEITEKGKEMILSQTEEQERE